MSEIIFLIEEAAEGGYSARALDYSIFTDGETIQEIKANIRDSVSCHFEENELPKLARMHFVRNEVFAV
jgi:predicted RNase H-like HicB family nuclease